MTPDMGTVVDNTMGPTSSPWVNEKDFKSGVEPLFVWERALKRTPCSWAR